MWAVLVHQQLWQTHQQYLRQALVPEDRSRLDFGLVSVPTMVPVSELLSKLESRSRLDFGLVTVPTLVPVSALLSNLESLPEQ